MSRERLLSTALLVGRWFGHNGLLAVEYPTRLQYQQFEVGYEEKASVFLLFLADLLALSLLQFFDTVAVIFNRSGVSKQILCMVFMS